MTPSYDKEHFSGNSLASFTSYNKNTAPVQPQLAAVSSVNPAIAGNTNTIAANTKMQKSIAAKGPNASDEQDMIRKIDNTQKFAVVLGSFAKPENAFIAKKQLASKGYNVNVVQFDDPNVQRLIIYYNSIEDAQNHLTEIRKQKDNSDAWLLTINTTSAN
jgi:cell division protein FtsN